MKELREAIYFVAIAWRPDTSAVGFLGIDVSIVVPFYGTQSTVEFEITVVDPLDRR